MGRRTSSIFLNARPSPTRPDEGLYGGYSATTLWGNIPSATKGPLRRSVRLIYEYSPRRTFCRRRSSWDDTRSEQSLQITTRTNRPSVPHCPRGRVDQP